MQNTKIFFTDDHAALRDALAGMINEVNGFEAVGVASNGKEAVAFFEGGLETDIILLDLNMPVMDGYATAEWLVKNRPGVKILIMTMGVSRKEIPRLVAADIRGILNKDASKVELIKALEAVRDGHRHFSEGVSEDIASALEQEAISAQLRERKPLTEPEKKFIRLCATELTYKEIGNQLGISVHATEALRVKVFEKLDMKNRAALAIYAVRAGIAGDDDQ